MNLLGDIIVHLFGGGVERHVGDLPGRPALKKGGEGKGRGRGFGLRTHTGSSKTILSAAVSRCVEQKSQGVLLP